MSLEDEYEFEQFVKHKETETIEKFKFFFNQHLFHPANDIFKIKRWLNNFKNLEQKLLALYILNNLTYRNLRMLESSITRIIFKDVKNIYENIYNINPQNIFDWFEFLKSDTSNLKIKFVGVNKDELSQSSATIARKLSSFIEKKYIAQREEDIIYAMSNDYLIVYVDDFVGSGKQFSDFLNLKIKTLPSYKDSKSKFIYAPLVAMAKGIEKINEEHSEVIICASEVISNEYQIFNKEDIDVFYKKFKRTPEQLLNVFEEMRKVFSIRKRSWNGRADAMLSVIFEWGCPNQSISMLYHDKNISKTSNKTLFFPLVPRRT